MKLKKGDTVQIMVGKDSGKSGKILKIDTKKGAALVEGLNFYKKHKKPTKQGEKGQIISVIRPLPISNLQFLCNGCGQPTRVGIRIEGDNKRGFCKKCKVTI